MVVLVVAPGSAVTVTTTHVAPTARLPTGVLPNSETAATGCHVALTGTPAARVPAVVVGTGTCQLATPGVDVAPRALTALVGARVTHVAAAGPTTADNPSVCVPAPPSQNAK